MPIFSIETIIKTISEDPILFIAVPLEQRTKEVCLAAIKNVDFKKHDPNLVMQYIAMQIPYKLINDKDIRKALKHLDKIAPKDWKNG